MNNASNAPAYTVGRWWIKPALQEEFRETIRLFHEYRNSVICEKCIKFDTQFDAVASLLKTYNKSVYNDTVSDLSCICALLDQGITAERKSQLIRRIDTIGYEKIRSAFETLMRICENQYQEKEDLFAILKRHRLHFPEPGSNEEKLYRIGQFMNMALINRNMMKKNGQGHLTESLMKLKYDASVILMPLIEEIFIATFGEEILREYA